MGVHAPWNPTATLTGAGAAGAANEIEVKCPQAEVELQAILAYRTAGAVLPVIEGYRASGHAVGDINHADFLFRFQPVTAGAPGDMEAVPGGPLPLNLHRQSPSIWLICSDAAAITYFVKLWLRSL